jgi:hypothetical protein
MKPASAEALQELKACVERERAKRILLSTHVERMAKVWKLSTRQRDVLTWLVNLGTRESWCKAFRVKGSTFDTHVKSLRAKVPGHPPIHRIVQRLLLDVAEGRTDQEQ